MVYKTFLETVALRLQNLIGDQAAVSLKQIPKNNGVILDSLCICRPQDSIAPAIYLDSYFRQYQNGVPIDSIIAEIWAVYQENSHPDEVRFRNFTSLSHARNHIVYKLISTAANRTLLQSLPHIPFLDLSIVFYLMFDDGETCFSSDIDERQLTRWEMSIDELFSLALENSLSMLPPTVRSLSDVIRGMAAAHLGDEYDADLIAKLVSEQNVSQPLYILTNTAEFHGAGCLLYPGQLKNFADAAESDLIVLPSSIHEVLLTPDRGSSRHSFFSNMVSQINEDEVRREEQLSDHIYLYSRESGRLYSPSGESAAIPSR